MTTLTLRHRHLEQTRAALVDRIERLSHDRAHRDQGLEADFAEQVVQCENDEVLERLEEAARIELDQIQHALAHLERGGGNRCERCGATIARARLAAVPHATQCTNCASLANGAERTVGASRPSTSPA